MCSDSGVRWSGHSGPTGRDHWARSLGEIPAHRPRSPGEITKGRPRSPGPRSSKAEITGIQNSSKKRTPACRPTHHSTVVIMIMCHCIQWYLIRNTASAQGSAEVNPANMRRWPNVGFLLAHRLRRWPNRKPTLAQRLMFAG